jgi:hypothetical protein
LRAAFVVELKKVAEVFNITVENSVEKGDGIFVSDSARDGSALCTGASAGTFVLQPSARSAGRRRPGKVIRSVA